MNISKQLCTMSQAINIFNAGIERKTMWYWMKKKDGAIGVVFRDHLADFKSEAEAVYPAYGVSHLMELMGDSVSLWKDKGQYCCAVHHSAYPLPDIKPGEFFTLKSEVSFAEAAAAMLITLRKNGLA